MLSLEMMAANWKFCQWANGLLAMKSKQSAVLELNSTSKRKYQYNMIKILQLQ